MTSHHRIIDADPAEIKALQKTAGTLYQIAAQAGVEPFLQSQIMAIRDAIEDGRCFMGVRIAYKSGEE